MKNNLYRKGFIVPVLIIIIALLVIGGGVYFYKNKKVEAPVVVNENESADINNKESKNNETPVNKDLGCTPNTKQEIKVLSPNGGENYTVGQKINIKWSSKCIGSNEKISISVGRVILNQDQAVEDLHDINTTNTGSYDWVISKDIYPGQYEVYVTYIFKNGYDSVFGRSDNLFNIKKIEEAKTMNVKVYFGDTLDAQSCNTPSYVERIIPKTTAVARASIEELLKGPTEAEKLKDFWTGLRSGVSINSISINNGVASLDLSTPQASSLNDPNKGACGAVISIKQIENTLKQFPTIKNVLITINGGKQDSINP